jgi:hypothetical protein
MVGGSLQVLRFLPLLKLAAMIAEILLKVALNTKNQSLGFLAENKSKNNEKSSNKQLN